MIAPGVAERNQAAAACRNAEIELLEVAERLSAVSRQLTGEVPTSAAVGFALAQQHIASAQAALHRAADLLYDADT